jgi:hypothetical protein
MLRDNLSSRFRPFNSSSAPTLPTAGSSPALTELELPGGTTVGLVPEQLASSAISFVVLTLHSGSVVFIIMVGIHKPFQKTLI